jgi:parallel beta-helix repeat protein
VDSCIYTYADGAGISFTGTNQVLLHSRAMYCGQEGVHATLTSGLRIIGSELAWNNTLPGKKYDTDWGAGGLKFTQVSGTVVNGVYSHDNNGAGIWFDIDCQKTTIKNCKVGNNGGAGIQYEISYAATITNNLVYGTRYNGTNLLAPDGIGIYISSSANCIVSHNTTVNNANFGLAIGGDVRDDGTGLKVYAHGNVVTRNIIADNQTKQPNIEIYVLQPSENTFNDNSYWNTRYTVKQPHFSNYGNRTFANWQASGQDAHSIFANPKFVNPAAGNFSLRHGSPAAPYGFQSDVKRKPRRG